MAKDKPVAGKASGAKAGMVSTGKAKAESADSKKYEPSVKGSGKPKYQNVVKEARVDTKAPRKEEIKSAIKNMTGRNVSEKEASRKASKKENIAKQIDREEKVRKGVRTESPSTPKVPVKNARTTSKNFTRPIGASGANFGGGGMNWETK